MNDRHARTLYLVKLAVTLAVVHSIAGCTTSTYVNKRAALKTKGRVIVIPLRDADKYYYDSQEGVDIADTATQSLHMNAENIASVPYEGVRGLVRSAVIEEEVDWKKVGEAAGADYVVHGSIDKLAWKDPDDPWLPRCVFTVSYTVYDAKLGADAYGATITGRYPFMLVADKGVTVFQMGPEGLRERALAYIGEVIARTFHRATITEAENESLVYREYKPAR